MQTLSEREILAVIAAGEPFEALLEGGALAIRVTEAVPYICAAIHAGGRFRPELESCCILTPEERRREEDPHTERFIAPFPITLIARDSRYEYDLNRPPEGCFYEEAFGRKVWKTPPPPEERRESLEKHAAFFRILKGLHQHLRRTFPQVLLLDLHSFNWQSSSRERAPVFNIGTKQLDLRRWSPLIRTMEKSLQEIELPNLDTSVARNTVFEGRGYLATFGRKELDGAPVIPLEVKKIFMDEVSGETFPLVMESLQQGIHRVILDTAAHFSSSLKRNRFRRVDLLPSALEPVVLQVDKALYALAKGVNTLNYVNPVNLQQEMRSFFSRRDYEPRFRYRQLRLDPYSFREKLYQLPVSKIQDPGLRRLYRAVVDSYAIKIELLTHVGTPHFLYNSLRYYGEPNASDLENARFILHAPPLPGLQRQPEDLGAEAVKKAFEKAAREHNMDLRVALSSRIVAKAMVDNSRRTLLINPVIRCSKAELEALISHELGVHMTTTVNAHNQPLKVLRLGLPGNTHTQEGMAILSEYLSGNLTLERLKVLALRVLAVYMMTRGESFGSVYGCLSQEYGQPLKSAFDITVRAYRGGGFTKDYLYLRGLCEMVRTYRKRSLLPLFTGKTSIEFIDLMDDLVERGIFKAPKIFPEAFSREQAAGTTTLDYLITALRNHEAIRAERGFAAA